MVTTLQGLYLDNPRVVDALAGGAAGRPTYALDLSLLLCAAVISVLGNLQGAPQLCLLVLLRS